MKLTIALILGVSAWVAIARLIYVVYVLRLQVDGLMQIEKLQNLQMMHFEAVIQKLRQDLGDEAFDTAPYPPQTAPDKTTHKTF